MWQSEKSDNLSLLILKDVSSVGNVRKNGLGSNWKAVGIRYNLEDTEDDEPAKSTYGSQTDFALSVPVSVSFIHFIEKIRASLMPELTMSIFSASDATFIICLDTKRLSNVHNDSSADSNTSVLINSRKNNVLIVFAGYFFYSSFFIPPVNISYVLHKMY